VGTNRAGFAAAPSGHPRILEKTLANLERAMDRVARRYNIHRRQVPFQVGDLVLVRRYPISSRLMRRSAKLENKWSNPLVIARFLTQVTVQLANPDTGVIVRKAHVSHLKRYFAADEVYRNVRHTNVMFFSFLIL
jgi:hypothetical protein